MNMNVFFTETDTQLQGFGLKGNKATQEKGLLFANTLLNSIAMDKKEIADNSMFSYEFAEMFQALTSEVDSQLYGHASSKSKGSFLENDVLFSNVLLTSMVNSNAISADVDLKKNLADFTELMNLISNLNFSEINDLQKLIHKMLENKNEEISILMEGQDAALINEKFGSVEAALMQLKGLLTTAQKSLSQSMGHSLHLKSQLDTLVATQSVSFAAKALEMIGKIGNGDTVAKEIIQSIAKEVDRMRELVNLLKNLISKSEQKAFHDETTNKQPLMKISHIPLHVQQYVTTLRKGDNITGTGKQEDNVKIDSKVVGTSIDTSGASQYKGNTNAEDRNQFNQHNQVHQVPRELQFRDQIMNANNQNIVHEASRNNGTTEVKLNFTNTTELQKQIQELVVSQAKYVNKPNGQQSMIVTLNPANLGTLKIIVTANQGQISTSITTDTLMTKELIENTLSSLRVALSNTGIQLDRIEVQQQNNQNHSTAQSASAQSQLQQQKRQQDQQDEQQNKRNKSTSKFSIEELEELALDFINDNQIDKRFIGNEGYSAAVNYTA